MKRVLIALCGFLAASTAIAQSVPNGGTITQGQVWTVSQWLSAWQSKADVASPGFTGTVTAGKVVINGQNTGTAAPLVVVDAPASPAAGYAAAKFGIANGTETGWTINPSANDWLAIYGYASSLSGRNRIWGINSNVDVPTGNPALAWSAEFDLNIATANAPDPHSGGNQAIGVDVVSGGSFGPSAAYTTLSTMLGNRWKHGLWFDSIGGQAGSTLIKANNNVSVDYGLDLSVATVNTQGVRVGNTPAAQVAPVALRQFANNQVGLFVQRFTDTAPTGNLIQGTNAANNAVLFQFDAVNGSLNIPTGVIAIGGTTGQTTGSINGQSLWVNNSILSLGTLIVSQSSTTTRVSTTTLTNDTVFTVAIPGPGTYQFRIDSVLANAAGVANGIQYNINCSCTFTTGSYGGYGAFAGPLSTQQGNTVSSTVTGSTANSGNLNASATGAGGVQGTIIATGAGTLALSWAQSASNASAMLIGNGSMFVNRIQ